MRKLRNTLVLAAACASFSSVGVLSQEYFVTTRGRDKVRVGASPATPTGTAVSPIGKTQ